jgi:hypothetical protein
MPILNLTCLRHGGVIAFRHVCYSSDLKPYLSKMKLRQGGYRGTGSLAPPLCALVRSRTDFWASHSIELYNVEGLRNKNEKRSIVRRSRSKH